MSRVKIDYGIDLGTTNSAIARMEAGESVVKQTKNLMDTLPSCVYFSQNKKGEKAVRVGVNAKNAVNSDAMTALKNNVQAQEYGYLEFKREMGTDKKYRNDHMPKESYSPEELSAEVLKELKSIIIDETINSVVITVPAMFTAVQKNATMAAAHIAGFKKCALLQEPIAACMAYGLSTDVKDGKWLVFDFGGGTFDAAIVKVEDGILVVSDTEGDNYLGGKNLDDAVINKILLPELNKSYDLGSYSSVNWKRKVLHDALKGPAEELRVALSFADSAEYSFFENPLNLKDDDGLDIDIDLDISLSKSQLADVVGEFYQKAVDICKDLLSRNGMSGGDLSSLVLVGGPTYSPILRDMLREQVTPNVDTSINPMTAVARGAALYASTLDADVDEEQVVSEAKSDVVFLQVGYESTSVEQSEWVSISVDATKNGSRPVPYLAVDIQRADGAWCSDRIPINANGNVVEVHLLSGKPNTFKVTAYDDESNRVEVFPSEFTIIQGVKVGAAPLPYNIGISVFNRVKKRNEFLPAKGLEKNKPLPAVGTISDRKTNSLLRPGVHSDSLKIPVYQVSGLDAEGRPVSLYTQIAEVEVTGDEVAKQIPENSAVDVKLYVDSSEMMTMDVSFRDQNVTVNKKLKLVKMSTKDAVAWVAEQLPHAKDSIKELKDSDLDVEALEREYESVRKLAASADDPMRALSNLKELLRKIDDLDSSTEWSREVEALRGMMHNLEEWQEDNGDSSSAAQIEEFRRQMQSVISLQDISLANELKDKMSSFFFENNKALAIVVFFAHCYNDFSSIRWTNPARARQAVDHVMNLIHNHAPLQEIFEAGSQVIDLLPPDSRPSGVGSLS